MLSFSNSSILCSGFIPTPVVQIMIWQTLPMIFLCFLDSVFLLFELHDFSLWRRSGIHV